MIYYVDKFQLLAVLNGCARNLSVSYLLAAYGEGNKSESQKIGKHMHTRNVTAVSKATFAIVFRTFSSI